MAEYEQALSDLENAIKVTALGDAKGKQAVRKANSAGEDTVEIGMRFGSAEQKAKWSRIAKPLTLCGDSAVEARAREIIKLCQDPRLASSSSGRSTAKPWWQFWK